MNESPAAASTGPSANPWSIAFRDPSIGFLLTDSVPVRGAIHIQRTENGGLDWTDVHLEPGARAGWIGFAGTSVVAAIGLGSGYDGEPRMLRSSDNGASWSSTAVTLPTGLAPAWPTLRLSFVDASVGYAVRDAAALYGPDPGLLKTADGGRTWRSVPLPRGTVPTGGVEFSTVRDGILTVAGLPGCTGAVLRTTDGGSSWSTATGSCVSFGLDAVSAASSTTLYAGGGIPDYYDTRGAAIANTHLGLLRSSDGGASWSVITAHGPTALSMFRALAMTSDGTGFAIVGSCKMGANGPCGGEVIATPDGGRTWTDTGRVGFRLTSHGPAGWLLAARSSAVWRTRDAGRSWDASVRPELLQISNVLRADDVVYLDTEIGVLQSADDGASWRVFDPPVFDGLQVWTRWGVGDGGRLFVNTFDTLRVSHDHGGTWTLGQFPTDLAGGRLVDDGAAHLVAFGTGTPCYPGGPKGAARAGDPASVAMTGDGMAWRSGAPVPIYLSELTARGGTTVATGRGLCGANDAVAISRDNLTTWSWRVLPTHYAPCVPSLASDRIVWLLCKEAGSAVTGQVHVFLSVDAGNTWVDRSADGAPFRQIVAVSASEAFATGSSGGLWHTLDGGASWSQSWPR